MARIELSADWDGAESTNDLDETQGKCRTQISELTMRERFYIRHTWTSYCIDTVLLIELKQPVKVLSFRDYVVASKIA